MTRQKVVIIGAGIGGIATANLLAKAGYEVTVYEKNAQLGGRAGLLEKDGFRFDTGPSWYLMPDVFRQYFSLFGKDVDAILDLVRLTPAYTVFFEDEPPLTVTGDLDQDAATFAVIEPAAGPRLKRYVSKSEEIYALSLKHFLYSNFTSVKDLLHHDVLAHGLTMARLALRPIHRHVARLFHDQRLQQVLEYPMVFLGASPFSAPALYSLMSALDFKEGVFYPQGGIYTIIEALLDIGRELDVKYRTESEVSRIESDGTRARGVTLASGEFVEADIVISNADLHFTETRLLAEPDRTYPAAYWDERQPGPSALLCYLGIKGSLPHLTHHNLFFAKDWKANFEAIYDTKTAPHPASLYVCKPSASDPAVAPEGHENLFVLVPLPAGLDLSPEETEQLADDYLGQLAAVMDVPDLNERIVTKTLFGPADFAAQYHAWQSTALGPSHILSQSAFFRTRNKSKKLANLFYVGGSTVPGIGLPMCLISAELVYKRLVGERRGGPVVAVDKIGER